MHQKASAYGKGFIKNTYINYHLLKLKHNVETESNKLWEKGESAADD